MLPRITIITPSYQQAPYLEECIRSLHDQGYPDLEHIIVDGGSTDGSKEIIERYADKLAWWCCEKDKGQSDAINKGLARATGHVFGWLNSDDLLLPGALHAVGEAFEEHPDMTVFTGVRIERAADGTDRTMGQDDPGDPDGFFIHPRINQQSTFMRMDHVKALRGVDEKLHYVMDYELWLQLMFRAGTEGVWVDPRPLSIFRLHPVSKTSTVHHRFLDEIASLLHGLAMATGQPELAQVLAKGHVISDGLRGIPVGPSAAPMVKRMVTWFLLRWHHTIYTEADLRMMKAFRQAVAVDERSLNAQQREWLAEVDASIDVPGWWAFRLRRKWTHLRSR
ncbi:MAG: glycosyltransferase [Flavobacteriales bacterium]|nr:glycosyltransferase [Flavobacteriales bacterium]